MPTRILVVEDEGKLRRVISLHLESAGFEVDHAPDAEQALPRAAAADVIQAGDAASVLQLVNCFKLEFNFFPNFTSSS